MTSRREFLKAAAVAPLALAGVAKVAKPKPVVINDRYRLFIIDDSAKASRMVQESCLVRVTGSITGGSFTVDYSSAQTA